MSLISSKLFQDKDKVPFIDLVAEHYNVDELGPLLEVQGNQKIDAIAGSGKTTAIMLRLLKDLTDGRLHKEVMYNGMPLKTLKGVWVSTFLKSAAIDLEESAIDVKNQLGLDVELGGVKFSTIHAEFYRLLKMIDPSVEVIDSRDQHRMLRDVMGELKIAKGKHSANEDVETFASILSFVKNRLDDLRFKHAGMNDIELDKDTLIKASALYDSKKRDLGVIDYDDMQWMLYKNITGANKNKKLMDLMRRRYQYMYFDEFQDVSQVQYEILKVYCEPIEGVDKRVVFVGDEDQVIYTWRGSDVELLRTRVMADFNPTVSQLTMNYRCPSNVVVGAERLIELAEDRTPKRLRAFNEGGIAEVHVLEEQSSMFEHAVRLCRKSRSEGKTVTILGRVNKDLTPLSVLFELDKDIDFSLGGSIYDLSRVGFRRYINLMGLFDNYGTENLNSNLRVLFPKAQFYERNKVLDILTKNEDIRLFSKEFEDLGIYLEGWEFYKNSIEGASSTMDSFEMLLIALKDSGRDLFEIDLLLTLIDRTRGFSPADFKNLIKVINNNLKLRSTKEDTDLKDIHLTTVHDFKGNESDVVIVWNVVDGVFPHVLSEDLEEERRIFYIACTRPREELYIITLDSNMSPYIEDVGYNSKYISGGLSTLDLFATPDFDSENSDDLVSVLMDKSSENIEITVPIGSLTI